MNDYWHIPRASLSSSSAASIASSSNRSRRSHSNPPLNSQQRALQNFALYQPPPPLTQQQQQQLQHQQLQQHHHHPHHHHLHYQQRQRLFNENRQLSDVDVGVRASTPSMAPAFDNISGRHSVGSERIHRMNSSALTTHESIKQTRAGHAKRINSARRNSEISGISNDGSGHGVVSNVVSSLRGKPEVNSIKRGSRSSQGSSDSNSSTRSAGSGSLLLTTANLERFVEIQNRQQQQQRQRQQCSKVYMDNLPTLHNTKTTTTTNYNTNLTHALQQHTGTIIGENVNNPKNCNNNDAATTINMDPNLDFIKTKDLDNVSIASSMHFTMVNGENGSNKKPKRGLCDRGRQVTVLITSMSIVFLLLIMGMVYALEMRAREMPQS